MANYFNTLNLRQQLSQDMALILQQPTGEPEFNMKDLQDTWGKIMLASKPEAAAVDDSHQDVTDIPPAQ